MSTQQGGTTDPQEKHDQPATEGEQLPGPGSSDSVTPHMGDEPDHGESTYRGAASSPTGWQLSPVVTPG